MKFVLVVALTIYGLTFMPLAQTGGATVGQTSLGSQYQSFVFAAEYEALISAVHDLTERENPTHKVSYEFSVSDKIKPTSVVILILNQTQILRSSLLTPFEIFSIYQA